ncbi:MAG: histone deacetylase [Candidatus Diapherotrites archaeon]|nr:histone deacetylase [Candidatus Diapherotrites archaeon]
MKIVYSERFLEHSFPYHPESPERLLAIKQFLDKKAEFEYIKPAKLSEKFLLAVHTERLLEELKMRSQTCSGTADNPFAENTFEIAMLSAGAAVQASKHADELAFSLARPPGHHAGRDFFGGFCYLNNGAIAVMHALKKYSRILIVDFDVHLGQGTQDIFSGNDSVFYLSFHQDTGTIYPWHDFPIKDNTTKLVPLQVGTTDGQYLKIFRRVFLQAVKKFEPELIACSAGFDMFHSDRLYVGTALRIERHETFKEIGAIINSVNLPGFAVLEGGYGLETLGLLVSNFLEGWQG